MSAVGTTSRGILGIDPGTQRTGIAVYHGGKIQVVRVLHPPAGTGDVKERLIWLGRELTRSVSSLFRAWDIERIVVEWQAIRPGDPRPNDILHLATVLGMVLAAEVPEWAEPRFDLPLPVEWRGSVPKEILHRRILAHAPGLQELLANVPKTHQGDAIDAAGLAMWGVERKRPWN